MASKGLFSVIVRRDLEKLRMVFEDRGIFGIYTSRIFNVCDDCMTADLILS